MVSLMSEKSSRKRSNGNPSEQLDSVRPKPKSKKNSIRANSKKKSKEGEDAEETQRYSDGNKVEAAQKLAFFIDEFQSTNKIQLSSLELESINDTCIVELRQGLDQDASTLGKHMQAAFKPSWKEMLYEKQLLEGKVEPGSPAILTISASALRSLELHRGVWPLTKECPAAKLFSKHMKVHDQVSLLKGRINIACGTPSRIKKLIDIEALGLSRLAVIMIDMHKDVKGYSLFTLPQVRDEFWDLYRTYFHEKLVRGELRICLYGPIPVDSGRKRKRGRQDE